MTLRATTAAILLAAGLSAFGEKAYVFSYFNDIPFGGRRGEAAGLRLATSPDAKRWTVVNEGRPVLVPEVGKDRLMRDPSICRGPDGTFHLVWTLSWYSNSIGYASSRDLIHWSEQREIPVMEGIPETRNCWAPEVTYNPDDGLFYVYWSSTVTGRHTPIPDMHRKEAGLNHRTYLSTTRDFETFSPPRLWFNPDFSTIDAFALRDPKDGSWILFAKNENHTPVQKNIVVAFSESLADGFREPVSGPITDHITEGPTAFFVGDELYLFYENYRRHFYGAMVSRDRGRTWADVTAEIEFPRDIRHGTVFEVDAGIVASLHRPGRFGQEAGLEKPADAVSDMTMLSLKMSAEKMNGLGERIRFTGEVKDVVRGADTVQMVLDDWHGSLVATIPLPARSKVPREWGVGARLCVCGTLSFRYPECDDFRIAVAKRDDVEVLRAPAWWTPVRLAAAITLVALLFLAILGWALLLRHQKAAELKVHDAVQKERLRLSSDLHDGYQQLLAGCMFRLTAAMTLGEKLRNGGSPALWCKVDEQFDGLRSSLTHAQDELRAALWTMKEEAEGPAAIGDLFRYAASRLPQWEGIVSFETEGEESPISRRYAGALLMILQEAVGNALRHGRAKHVKVRVVFGRKGLAMIVKDDGCGFDVAASGGAPGVHLGLKSMQSRAENIGGRFAVRSTPGSGTEVKVVLEA